MFFRKSSTESAQTLINVMSAHGLWKLLSHRFYILNQMRIIDNFVHDHDFKFLIERIMKSYQNEANELLQLMTQYNVPGLTPPTEGRHVIGNSQVITDRSIAHALLLFMQADITVFLEMIRGATTNDDIMAKFIKMADEAFEKLSNFIIYLKFKGWVDLPPLYPYIPEHLNEKVAANEIYLLFDHLVSRYNSIQYTKIMSGYVSDPDFRMVLEMGMNALEDQSKQLEHRLNHYGVPLPNRFSPIIPTPEDKQILEDRFIFNVVLVGVENATMLHGSALKEVIVNDQLRAFFRKLTFDELEFVARMVKYGKLKGWMNEIPIYRFGAK